MSENNLCVSKNAKLKARRSATTSKPRTIEPNRIWGTDMTKVRTLYGGWAYLHVVIDWGSKAFIGACVSHTSKTSDWLCALNDSVNRQFPNGIRMHDSLMLVSDNGCQPTSKRYQKECHYLNIQQVFTSFNNPKGNADTERFIRTLKEDLVWPREWENISDFSHAVTEWMDDYNKKFPHSSIGKIPPYEYERWFYASNAA